MKDLSLMLATILALGIAAQWLGWFLKKPAIIFLLAAGLLLGPTFHVFNPDELLGNLLFPVISLGVAVILFEGALTLNLPEIKNHGMVVTKLVSIGVVITIAITAFAAWAIMDLSFPIALLFGALVCVTGPTVIVPLLRSVRPNRAISNILRWEGIIIDPIGALLVVLIYGWIIAGHSPLIFAKSIFIGLVLGFAAAFALATALKKQWIPEYLQNVGTLACVLLIFSISNALAEESGLLTVTVMGMMMANIKSLHTDDIVDFKETLSILIISLLFILLAARVNFQGFVQMGFGGIVVLLIVMLIARPISVWVCALGSPLSRNEKLLISWIAPRGIVAAAVSSLFVLKLQLGGNQEADILVPMVFTIIIGTVMLQSLSAKALAIKLGVAESASNGVLITGSQPFAITLGKSLQENGIEVLIASNQYQQSQRARMAGLASYYGNPVSEYADRKLNLIGIGHLIALHSREEENLLAALRYRNEFGKENVYRIRIEHQEQDGEIHRDDWQSPWLFGKDISNAQLQESLNKGAAIKMTTLSEAYTWEQYQSDNAQNIALYALDKKDGLHIFSSASNLKPQKGWKIAALVIKAEEKARKKAEDRLENLS